MPSFCSEKLFHSLNVLFPVKVGRGSCGSLWPDGNLCVEPVDEPAEGLQGLDISWVFRKKLVPKGSSDQGGGLYFSILEDDPLALVLGEGGDQPALPHWTWFDNSYFRKI